MTEQPAEIDLPRFHRQIGVSGFAAGDNGVGAQFHIGVVRPFTGVLDTMVIEGDQLRAIPDLSYLTLEQQIPHPIETSDQRPQQSAQSRGEPGESSSGETNEEPTVREVLREQPRTESDADTAQASDTTSNLTTLDRVVRDVRQNRTQQLQTSRLMGQSHEDRSDSPATHPLTVVVDRSPAEGATLDGDGNEDDGEIDPNYERAATGDESTGGSAEPWSGTERPAMILLERGVRAGDNANPTASGTTPGADVTEPRLPGMDTDTGANAAAWSERPASQGPDLTVEHTGQSGRANDIDPAGRSATATRASESITGTRPGATNDAPSEERAIIREDGSVNDRVFDRIYRELQRRERRDSRREGR